MKPVPTSHNEYRGFLRKMLREYFPDLSKIGKGTWRIYNEFKSLDLSMVDAFLRDKYSIFGPPPRQPSCMFRSLLLMVKCKITYITVWVQTMHITPMYAILSGFDPDAIPGVGTFYDFISRLWDYPTDNYSKQVKPVPVKVKRPKGKGKKAESVEKESVCDLISRLSATAFCLENEAYHTIFNIFSSCFVSESIRRGVIHPKRSDPSGRSPPCWG